MTIKIRPGIKELVRRRFGTLTAFADKVGWSVPQASRIVNGKSGWSMQVLDTLCGELQMQPGELLLSTGSTDASRTDEKGALTLVPGHSKGARPSEQGLQLENIASSEDLLLRAIMEAYGAGDQLSLVEGLRDDLQDLLRTVEKMFFALSHTTDPPIDLSSEDWQAVSDAIALLKSKVDALRQGLTK